jgi:hypothetical protein
MKKLLPVVILGCLLLSPAALAGKFYIGVAAGEATLKAPAADGRFSVDDTAYKVFAGYRMARWLAIEGAYTDMGTLEGEQEGLLYEAQAEALAAHAVGVLPITPRARIFAKIGLASWDTASTTTDGEATDRRDASGMDLSYGFGLGYDLTRRFGLRLEWETYDFDNTEDVKVLSLGAQINF